MPRRHRIDALGAALLIGVAAVLGLNQVMVKLVNEGMSPVMQAGLRSACAVLPVWAYARVTGKRLSLAPHTILPGIACGLIFSAEFILLFQGIAFTSVAHASILFYTMPVWVALGAHVLIPGERLTPVRLSGLALAVAGVAVALSGAGAVSSARALVGDLMCLVAAMLWAGLALTVRCSALSREANEVALLWQLGLSAAILIPLAYALGDPVRAFTPMIGAIFAAQVILVAVVGYLVWFWVLSVYPASDMAAFGFLSPLFGVGFGWLMLNEPLSLRVALALGLVGAGIVLVTRRPGAA